MFKTLLHFLKPLFIGSFLCIGVLPIFISGEIHTPPFLGAPFDDHDFFMERRGFEKKLEGIEPYGLLHRTQAPRPLLPTFYEIQIRPLFDPKENEHERFTVPGSVKITVDCVSDTKTIYLNAKYITFYAAATKVTKKGQTTEIEIESQDFMQDGRIRIITKTPLNFGATYEIYMEYIALVFRDRLDGLYLSNYTNPTKNKTEYLVVTHFEPQGARQLFPSFDEPDLKAVFELRVGRREEYNSISNMDLLESTPIAGLQGWYWDRFKPTVKMSTYLIAVVVSKFQSAAADSKLFGGKSVKVWAPEHYIQKGGGAFGAETAAKILNFYEQYFGMKYPLPKMDSAAIPHFEAGAMENYGLNTYREKYLLYFDGVSTEAERNRVCSVIAHELGHQWFGDLVTCKSWSQLWLNEGFAAFVENIGEDAACPEFEPWTLFVSQTMQSAMQYDQSSQAHPIVNDSDTTARFSKITYNKGASLLRMLREFLGEETFVKGLWNYLKQQSYGNVHQEDLFAALEAQAREDRVASISKAETLSSIMESWTLKKGFPLVRVEILNSTAITLTQEAFVKPKYLRDRREIEKTTLWSIPITIQTAGAERQNLKFWIPSKTNSLEKSGIDTQDWFIVNPDAIGYFRVFYDANVLSKIQKQLEDDPSRVSPNARSQLLDDYFNFAFLNHVDIISSLKLTTYLHKEDSYNVWITVYTNLKRTMSLLSATPAQQSLSDYLAPKLNAVLKLIGFEQHEAEKGIRVNFRSFLLAWACSLKDKDCEQYALKLFRQWMSNSSKNKIPVDIQSTVYCTAVRLDTDNTIWDFVQEKYAMETGRQKTLLLNSLACSSDSSKISRMLTLALDTDHFSAEESDAFIRKVATFPSGRKNVFKFLCQKPERIIKLYKKEKKLEETLKLLSSYFHAQHEQEQIRKLAEDRRFELDPQTVAAILQVVDDNRTWMSKFYIPIKSWLEDQVAPAP